MGTGAFTPLNPMVRRGLGMQHLRSWLAPTEVLPGLGRGGCHWTGGSSFSTSDRSNKRSPCLWSGENEQYSVRNLSDQSRVAPAPQQVAWNESSPKCHHVGPRIPPSFHRPLRHYSKPKVSTYWVMVGVTRRRIGLPPKREAQHQCCCNKPQPSVGHAATIG